MRAGRLDRRVRLIAPGTLTHNGMANVTGGETTLAIVAAEFKPGKGSERLENARVAADAPVTWRIRWSPDVAALDPRHRLVEQRGSEDFGPVFDIHSVVELGRREGFEIVAVARADGGG